MGDNHSKKYDISDSDSIIDDWFSIFRVTSLTEFKTFKDMLEFPQDIDPELTRISKDFVVAALNYMMIQHPANIVGEQYDESLPIDPLIQIWDRSFERLQAIGLADIFYEWGKRIHAHTKLASLYSSPWDILLSRWATAANLDEFPIINLDGKVIDRLRSLILYYETNKKRNSSLVTHVKENTSDPWDSFQFNTESLGSWIDNVANSRNHFSKWQAITSDFSVEELEAINEWGMNIMSPSINSLSLFEYAQKLESYST